MSTRSEEQGPLEIQESASAPPKVTGDGTVLIQLIRPCVGRGKGRHVYEPDMLRENASVFSGWKMFVDHQSDVEKKALGGLPRSIDHLGGIVLESYWDPNVPAEGRFGQGAVMGKVRAVPKVLELAKLHSSLVESSINAQATAVKPVTREGKRAWLVEGIEKKGTVDWVTEGGAGGQIVSLLEAAQGTPDEEEAALLESMTDDEVRETLLRERPGVFELEEGKMPPQFAANAKKKKDAAAADDGDGKDAEDKADGGADDELEALVAKYVKGGMSDKFARMAAKKKLASKSAKEAAIEPDEGDTVAVTAEDIQEAIVTSPEVAQLLRDLVEAGVADALTEAREEMRTTARAEAFADSERQLEVRDMRDTAHAKIREAKLPEEFERRALDYFQVTSDGPTGPLDVFESYDAEGEITQTAEEALLETVEAVIDDQRQLVASLRPTRVRGQGPRTVATGEGKEGREAASEKVDRVGPLTRSMLQEAGFKDPEKVYEGATQ